MNITETDEILYYKIPKQIITIEGICDKPSQRISTFIFLCNHLNFMSRIISLKVNDVIRETGYSTSRNSKRSESLRDKFIEAFKFLYDSDIIRSMNIEELQQNLDTKVKVNPQWFTYLNDNYGRIYNFEYDSIINAKLQYHRLDKGTLLLVLSYIRAYSYHRKDGDRNYVDNPEVTHVYINYMADTIGISEKMCAKSLDVLSELGIIKSQTLHSFKNEGNEWRRNGVVIVTPYRYVIENYDIVKDDSYEWEKELEYGLKMYNKSTKTTYNLNSDISKLPPLRLEDKTSSDKQDTEPSYETARDLFKPVEIAETEDDSDEDFISHLEKKHKTGGEDNKLSDTTIRQIIGIREQIRGIRDFINNPKSNPVSVRSAMKSLPQYEDNLKELERQYNVNANDLVEPPEEESDTLKYLRSLN